MLNAELIVPMPALRPPPLLNLRLTVCQAAFAILQPARAQLPQPVHHIQVGPRRLQHPWRKPPYLPPPLWTQEPELAAPPHPLAPVHGSRPGKRAPTPPAAPHPAAPAPARPQLPAPSATDARGALQSPATRSLLSPVEFSGCPTLAAFLFLRLGWETKNHSWPPSIESTTFEATAPAGTL